MQYYWECLDPAGRPCYNVTTGDEYDYLLPLRKEQKVHPDGPQLTLPPYALCTRQQAQRPVRSHSRTHKHEHERKRKRKRTRTGPAPRALF